MKVRRLTGQDAEAYRAIRLRSLAEHPAAYGSTLADWQDATVSDFRKAAETRYVIGLFGPDKVIVGLAAYDRERGGNTRHRAFVTAVYVAPDVRGLGGAGQLLGVIEDQARADGVTQLELHVAEDNAAAMACYVRAGFSAQGRSPRALLYQGRYLDEVLMVRFLDGAGAD